jgi:hypothetical protein
MVLVGMKGILGWLVLLHYDQGHGRKLEYVAFSCWRGSGYVDDDDNDGRMFASTP